MTDFWIARDSFSRPADTTQYAVADLVANSTTAGSVVPLSWPRTENTVIRRAMLTKDDDDPTSAQFRLHLFHGDPTASAPANGDNGAISLNTAIAEYLGSIDLNLSASPDIYNDAGNVEIGIPLQGQEIFVPPGTDLLYSLLEARATYTPASGETFTVEIQFIRP